MQARGDFVLAFPHSGKDCAHILVLAMEHQLTEDIMSKFLWFLGGCATGLLAAAAIGYICEDTADSADRAMSWDEEPEDFGSKREDDTVFPRHSSSDADPDIIVPTV
jgi:hypothetical protein